MAPAQQGPQLGLRWVNGAPGGRGEELPPAAPATWLLRSAFETGSVLAMLITKDTTSGFQPCYLVKRYKYILQAIWGRKCTCSGFKKMF